MQKAAVHHVLTLVSIACSHYVEKSRWTLDHLEIAFTEEAHAVGTHRFTLSGYGASTVPILVVDPSLTLLDSTDIVKWANNTTVANRRLLPEDPGQLTDALMQEELYDEKLGPAARIATYHYLLPYKEMALSVMAPLSMVPSWEVTTLRWTFWALAPAMRKTLNINNASATEARRIIDELFERVSTRLAGGKRYLIGDTFSVADLTFASLASPVLLPPEHPLYAPLYSPSLPELYAYVTKLRATPAGQFAMRLYAEERNR